MNYTCTLFAGVYLPIAFSFPTLISLCMYMYVLSEFNQYKLILYVSQ